jgi:hypothetical protein
MCPSATMLRNLAIIVIGQWDVIGSYNSSSTHRSHRVGCTRWSLGRVSQFSPCIQPASHLKLTETNSWLMATSSSCEPIPLFFPGRRSTGASSSDYDTTHHFGQSASKSHADSCFEVVAFGQLSNSSHRHVLNANEFSIPRRPFQ